MKNIVVVNLVVIMRLDIIKILALINTRTKLWTTTINPVWVGLFKHHKAGGPSTPTDNISGLVQSRN